MGVIRINLRIGLTGVSVSIIGLTILTDIFSLYRRKYMLNKFRKSPKLNNLKDLLKSDSSAV